MKKRTVALFLGLMLAASGVLSACSSNMKAPVTSVAAPTGGEQKGESSGDSDTATQAVAEVPNLSIPWCLLGKIRRERGENEEAERYFRKYKLLTFGAFSGSKELTDKALKLTFLQEKDLFQSYGMKFREWYGYPLITLQ